MEAVSAGAFFFLTSRSRREYFRQGGVGVDVFGKEAFRERCLRPRYSRRGRFFVNEFSTKARFAQAFSRRIF